MPSSSDRCAAELKFLFDYQFKNWSTHVEGEMQMNEITSREVFFTAVFEAGISICKTSVHTCCCRVQAPTRGTYVEAAALRRTDGWGARITVLGVPRRVFRFYADEDLYAKFWRLLTYCDCYYVHVLRPPF